jgi:hypothetical protein
LAVLRCAVLAVRIALLLAEMVVCVALRRRAVRWLLRVLQYSAGVLCCVGRAAVMFVLALTAARAAL